MSSADVNFDMEAHVALEIGVDSDGNFIDARTGSSNRSVIEKYSRMKYGDMDAVRFFARQLADSSLKDGRFMSFLRDAEHCGRFTYITSTAIFNAPSASNLLVRTTAEHLNVALSKSDLSPLIIAEQTRLSDSVFTYASMTVRERASESVEGGGAVVTIVPEKFRDQSVIFLDDLFNTGAASTRAKRRFREINAADVYYLFAARMDPHAVAASNGTIEQRLNESVIDGTLNSVAPILNGGNFAVVQKLLRVILDPKHTHQLPDFFQEIPTSTMVTLYSAAACDGFHRRHMRQFVPSLSVMETMLQQRGALDAEGRLS